MNSQFPPYVVDDLCSQHTPHSTALLSTTHYELTLLLSLYHLFNQPRHVTSFKFIYIFSLSRLAVQLCRPLACSHHQQQQQRSSTNSRPPPPTTPTQLTESDASLSYILKHTRTGTRSFSGTNFQSKESHVHSLLTEDPASQQQ